MSTIVKSYNQSALWALFLEKAENNHKLIDKLSEFCDAAEDLSRRIVITFPDYTIHDGKHIAGVCEWMHKLLQGQTKYVSLGEVVLLLMSACCHDLGMAIEDGEDLELIEEATTGFDPEWERYFDRHPNDMNIIDDRAEHKRILQNYVRETHHLRAAKKIEKLPWDTIFFSEFGISKDLIASICQSHGEKLAHIDCGECALDDIDPDFCAILLRLGDAMDYDSNRAPRVLYKFLGLDITRDENRFRSHMEWLKNFSGAFHRPKNNRSTITYRAEDIPQPALLSELDKYVSWVGEELLVCKKHLEENSQRWINHDPLPLFLNKNIKGKGFKSADFKMRMDQSKVLELLSGEDLYSEPGIFVRELLQNSIDAVHARCELDDGFTIDDGLITVDVWDEGQYFWFRIKDNGTGMDERIIKSYLLNIGRSYYNDANGFKKDLALHGSKKNCTAISQFGIGILSCFMGSGNDNAIEISTKHHSKNSKPIRLSIPGMEGLYFLTELSSTQRGEPMPGPRGNETEDYLREAGTTVCVRINKVNMESEAVDQCFFQYVAIPDVRIEYNSTSAHFIAPTVKEFESLVNKLNPDFEKTGIATAHKHFVSENIIDIIKTDIPEVDWKQLPALSIQYWPLRKMSGTTNLSGVVITYDSGIYYIPYSLDYNGALFTDAIHVRLGNRASRYSYKFNMEIDKEKLRRFTENTSVEHAAAIKNRLKYIKKRINEFEYKFELDEDEKKLHLFFETHNTYIVYNGIDTHTDTKLFRSSTDGVSGGIILFSGDYRPRVSMARNGITDLPLEAACDLSVQLHRAGVSYPRLPCTALSTASLSEYLRLFMEHDSWTYTMKECLSSKIKMNIESPFYYLQIAWIKNEGYEILPIELHTRDYVDTLPFPYIRINMDVKPVPDRYNDETSFPPMLFMPIHDGKYIGAIWGKAWGSPICRSKQLESGTWVITSYSKSSSMFSWLTIQREKLQAEVTSVYNRIIDCVMEGSPESFCSRINSELAHLRIIPGDPYNARTVSDFNTDLVLELGYVIPYFLDNTLNFVKI